MGTRRFRLGLLALAVLITLGLLFIAGRSGGQHLTTVSLVLDRPPNASHAGLYLAKTRGVFAANGLDIALRTPLDASSALRDVAAGRDDFGIISQPDLVMARDQGARVVAVASLLQHPLSSVMALKTSGIARPRDLVGRKIGYSGDGTSVALLRAMVEGDGGDFSTAELVNIGPGLAATLLSKRVDAVVSAHRLDNVMIEQQGQEVVVLKVNDWGVPDYYGLLLVTSELTLKERPQLVLRALRAILEGYDLASRDLDAAVEALASAALDIDQALEQRNVRLLAPAWTENAPSFGWQTTERWEALAGWMLARGLTTRPVDPAKIFTNSYTAEISKGK
ncbi:MAG: ABC transporter substrate-binding protein [SAR202 cluster bacterium]|nr:ABC transporter substrate-binding protein [SAR202 cluster bacterium]